MSRAIRLGMAVAAVAATAFASVPAQATPGCTVTMKTQRFAGPGGGTWTVTYPEVTCA